MLSPQSQSRVSQSLYITILLDYRMFGASFNEEPLAAIITSVVPISLFLPFLCNPTTPCVHVEAAVDEHATFLSSQANLVLVQSNSLCWIQRTFLIELLCEESQFDVSSRGEMSFGV
jgi:hypothetical protein